MTEMETLRCPRCRRIICRCVLPLGAVLEHKCHCNFLTTVRVIEVEHQVATVVSTSRGIMPLLESHGAPV